MKESTINDTVGSLKISEEVLSKIASTAAREINGVAALAAMPTTFKGLVSKPVVPRPVKIVVRDDVAVIDVYVNLVSGAKIQEVAQQIQSNVKASVQSMTGIAVSKVNVHVVSILFEDSGEKQ
ncbi:MAG: Asp23/Gls24 family envelope stress response protein [Acetanaerobacterium sp.]